MVGTGIALEFCRRSTEGRRRFKAAVFSIAILFGASGAPAQAPPLAVVEPGEAAVTGFSGAVPPSLIAPGEDPATKTFIDLRGPSLRIVDLRHLGGRPAGQVVAAPKPFTVPASLIGQVFGVALDDDPAPNVYVAATSAYGLPIVAPSPDGTAQHVRTGAQTAAFMPGLWGQGGGPGSIYKIDGRTGRVSHFASVTTDGRPNSGAALGALAFDRDSKTLFVADRESGLIHRLSIAGKHLGVYDHGATGRAAQGLPPVLWTSRRPIDVANPGFDSADPATWNYAAPGRRVFALSVHDHRLYYAVADGLQIWSVGLRPDGALGDDAIIELAVPPSGGPTEIASIAFDDQGRMLLAERPDATGAFSFEPLSVPAIGRVLRYAIVGQAAGGRRVWQEVPDEYAVGFAGDWRNANGGVAVGYNYDSKGDVTFESCGGFLWETGEDLRDPLDPALAGKVLRSGPLHIDGLQGEGLWDDRPRNAPPIGAYFAGYRDGPWADAAHGQMGAISIHRSCAQIQATIGPPQRPPAGSSAAPPRPVPPPAPHTPPSAPLTPPSSVTPPPPLIPTPTPPNVCNPNEVRRVDTGACVPGCSRPDVQIGGKCCPPSALAANAACSNASCPAGQTSIGPSNFCCDASHVYTGSGGAPACCPQGLVNGRCAPQPNPTCTPGANGACSACPSGYVSIGGSCCAASQATSTGVCCPTGTVAGGTNNGQCVPIVHIPFGPVCCVAGKIPTPNGVCCAAANVTTAGVCCSSPVNPTDRSVCPVPKRAGPAPLTAPLCAPGYIRLPNGGCCRAGDLGADGRSCRPAATAAPCARGQARNALGACITVTPSPCPAGQIRNNADVCVPAAPPPCPPGRARNGAGVCAPIASPPCPRGQTRSRAGACVPMAPLPCPPGQTRNPAGACTPVVPPPCPPSQMRNHEGACAPVQATCPPGQIRTRAGACAPAVPPACPPGQARNPFGVCAPPVAPCPAGEVRNRDGVCVRLPLGAPPPSPFSRPPQ